MRIQKLATLTTIGVALTGVGLAALVSAAASSSAANTTPTVARHVHVAAAPPARRVAAPAATPRHGASARRAAATSTDAPTDAPTDVTVTSRNQVAWTRRASADTTPAENRCTPITGADGKPLEAGGGGFVYPALVNDAQAESDIGAMYTAMAAGDQAAYDAAYHQLDLRVNCT